MTDVPVSLWFQVLPMLRDADSYRDLLDRTAATLDKMEEQLKSGDGWLLGKAFSAVDILLGVILNRLALLGYQVQDSSPLNGSSILSNDNSA